MHDGTGFNCVRREQLVCSPELHMLELGLSQPNADRYAGIEQDALQPGDEKTCAFRVGNKAQARLPGASRGSHQKQTPKVF
jgi:hypothetical protein